MKVLVLTMVMGWSCCCVLAQKEVTYQPLAVVPVHNHLTPLPMLGYFARHLPQVEPYWGIKGKNYVVRYIDPDNALVHVIVYNRHGVILHREDEVKIEDCPAGLQAYYFENYADESLRVWIYEEGEETKYFLKRKSKTVWFDKDGNYLGKKLLGII